ncbi:MAG: VIT domain-containing protein [Anaerolineae bacterium]
MKARIFVMAMVLLGLMVSMPGLAYADGIIIPEPPPPIPPIDFPNLAIKYHRVTVTIEDQVATTHVDQVFLNDTPYELEGTYIFPLPEEASISEFAMWVDGEKLEGQVLDKDQARQIYEEIVRKRRDPALLEYMGRNAFQARIFPIPAHGEKRVELEYSQVLPMDQGLIEYIYPLNTEKFSSRPLEEVAISVRIRSREAIRAIYSPSHDVVVDREGDYAARVGYEEYDVKPDRDFALYYTISAEDFGLNLLSYKPRGEDGFFLLLVAPQVEVETSRVVAKDVIFVLDTSGSMKGGKLEQAKKALEFVLDNLNEEDRFNIITFSTGVRQYARGLRPADEAGEALRYVRNLRAGGGTDINRALLEALNQADSERPQIIIFLTDGLATEGVVETDTILSNVADAAPEAARLFTFGVGDDVNTILLDTLAQEHRGASAYVRPGQNIEEEVSAFYAKVSTPLLSDIDLDFGDIRVEETYPYPLPDLFAGTQLVMVGRYREGGPTAVTLKGEVNEEAQQFVYEDVSFRRQGGQEFIARLWATRKIGYLLTQIRLHGESKELIEEIVDLSVRYGIITPYTSFLIEEMEDVLREEGRERVVEQQAQIMGTPAPAYGAGAVEKSVAQEALRSADTVSGPTVEQVKHVGDKAFLFHDDTWIDTAYDPDKMETVKVGFGTEPYFQLLTARPQWGRYFALGQHVIVLLEGQAYEITEGDYGPVPIPSGRSEEVDLVLKVDVTKGTAPLTVSFRAELVGGPDNNQDFYCASYTFDFGDGTAMHAEPDCLPYWPEVEIQRRFETDYTYEKEGTYTAGFSLGGLHSNTMTIVVGSGEQAPSGSTSRAAPQAPACLGGLFGALLLPILGLVGACRRRE